MDPSRAKAFAETYERHFVPAMTRPWAEILVGQSELRPGQRALDVACGTGIVARLAAPAVGPAGRVAALDRNPAMLEVARSLPPPPGAPIAWQEGDALALPYPSGSFDAAFCQHGLPFVPDPGRAVAELRRVLAPGGQAQVLVLQDLDRHPVFRALMEAVAAALGVPVAEVALPFALSDPQALAALFTGAGFDRVDLGPVGITARFPSAKAFVAMALMSGAVAVPAFARMDEPGRAALQEEVRTTVGPVLDGWRDGEAVRFPMVSHRVVAA